MEGIYIRMDKMVLVEWVDSVRNSGWDARKIHAEMKASICTSVGYLLFDGEDNLVIYQSWDAANNSCGMSLTIPKIAVKSMVELRRK